MSDLNLFSSEDLLSLDQVIDKMGDAFGVCDDKLVFTAANQKFAASYGFQSPEQILGKTAFEIYPDFKKSVFYEACMVVVKTGQPQSRVGYSNNIKDWLVMRFAKIEENRFAFQIYPLPNSAGMSGCISNIDQLTSLPNRVAFEQEVSSLSQYHQSLSVALFNISHFKHFNETLGFEAGDKCLMEIAARLKRILGSSDRVYRLGNDHFLLLGTSGSPILKDVVNRALDVLSEPMEFSGLACVLHFNVGLADKEPNQNVEELLKHAEHALARAKSKKSRLEEHVPGQINTLYDHLKIKSLHDAFRRKEMTLYMQPQIDGLDGRIVGVEGLVRWNHPEKGLLAPSAFLPLLEEAGMSTQLDELVLDLAFEQLVDWKNKQNPIQISINLSAQSIINPQLLTMVRDRLVETKVRPAALCVEITEGALIEDVEASQEVIEGLKNLGVEVAIDDFGTGYCSMAYLLRYPSHFLKIDRSFVQNFHLEENKQTMVKNMIALAHGLGIGVVAEGVEIKEEFDLLQSMGCDLTQGYYHAKPMSKNDLEEWIKNREVGSLVSNIF